MAEEVKPATDEEILSWGSDARELRIVRPSKGLYVTDPTVVFKVLALIARIRQEEHEGKIAFDAGYAAGQGLNEGRIAEMERENAALLVRHQELAAQLVEKEAENADLRAKLAAALPFVGEGEKEPRLFSKDKKE